MSGGPQIDWNSELGQKPAAPSAGPNIDWTKELSSPATPSPAPVGNTLRARPDHPIRNWLEDAQEDIHHGTTLTFPGKVLHALGATGLDTGTSPGASQVMQTMSPLGLLTGPFEAAHGGIEAADPANNRGQQVRGANELLGGVGKTVGGALPFAAPAHLGQMVPTLATFGPLQQGAQKAASAAGADPDSAELIGNMSSLMAPVGKGMAEGAGKVISRGAGPITKAAGVIEGIDQLRRGHLANAAGSLFLGGSPHTEALVKGIGDLVQGAAGAPLLPHELSAPETIEGPGNLDKPSFMPGNRDYMGMNPRPANVETPNGVVMPPEQKALPRGAIIPPAPAAAADEPGQLVNAQAISTRGQGGKFTRQYLTGEDQTGGKSVPAAQQGQAWQAPDLGPKAPPRVIDGKLVDTPKFDVETGSSSGSIEQPTTNPEHQQFMDEWRGKNQKKPLVNTQPLTNDANSGNMNNMPENQTNPQVDPVQKAAHIYDYIHEVSQVPGHQGYFEDMSPEGLASLSPQDLALEFGLEDQPEVAQHLANMLKQPPIGEPESKPDAAHDELVQRSLDQTESDTGTVKEDPDQIKDQLSKTRVLGINENGDYTRFTPKNIDIKSVNTKGNIKIVDFTSDVGGVTKSYQAYIGPKETSIFPKDATEFKRPKPNLDYDEDEHEDDREHPRTEIPDFIKGKTVDQNGNKYNSKFELEDPDNLKTDPEDYTEDMLTTTLSKPHTLYHGTRPNRATNLIKTQKPDMVGSDYGHMQEPGFWLSDKDNASGYADGAMVKITLPKGTKVYSHPDEDGVGVMIDRIPEGSKIEDATHEINEKYHRLHKSFYTRSYHPSDENEDEPEALSPADTGTVKEDPDQIPAQEKPKPERYDKNEYPKFKNTLTPKETEEFKDIVGHLPESEQEFELNKHNAYSQFFKKPDKMDKAFAFSWSSGELGTTSGDEIGIFNISRKDANRLAWVEGQINGGYEPPIKTLDPSNLKTVQTYMDPEKVKEHLASEGDHSPIIVYHINGNDVVVDGNHRVEAAKQAGRQVTARYYDYDALKDHSKTLTPTQLEEGKPFKEK